MMLTSERTNSNNPHYQSLVSQLDVTLRILDGDDHDFYASHNKSDKIKHVIVVFENQVAVGCGAIREFSKNTTEVKRMFVKPSHRRKGIASFVLTALEQWAKELGYTKCILETGYKQSEAIALYKNRGYTIIENYEPYTGVENSICFEKYL